MNADFQLTTDQILKSLGKELGIPEIEFEKESETCILQIGESLHLNISRDEENREIILHGEIGFLPIHNRQEITEQLLEANLFWAGTHGATISMERNTGTIIVAKALTLFQSNGTLLQGLTLAQAIGDIVDVIECWSTILEKKKA